MASVDELEDAIADATVHLAELSPVGSPYILDSELTLDRNVSLRAEGVATLNAAASAVDQRRVLSVSAGAHVELHGLTLRGAWTGLALGSEPLLGIQVETLPSLYVKHIKVIRC